MMLRPSLMIITGPRDDHEHARDDALLKDYSPGEGCGAGTPDATKARTEP
jgi:hypothetical protein